MDKENKVIDGDTVVKRTLKRIETPQMNKIFIYFFIFFINCFPQTAEELSRELMSNVVLLEKKVGDELIPHDTGTLFYNYINPAQSIIVTNEHVLRNKEIYVVIHMTSALKDTLKKYNDTLININGQIWEVIGNTLIAEFLLIKNLTFVTHDSLDIAAFPIYMGSFFRKDSKDFRASNIRAIPQSLVKYKDSQIVTNHVYFVGFPLGIGTPSGLRTKNEKDIVEEFYKVEVPLPLVRSDIIAWLADNNNEFLLDALSFGGNSGSPIYTNILGDNLYYVGMVFGHWGSSNSNIGLARCYWADEIMKVVEKASKL